MRAYTDAVDQVIHGGHHKPNRTGVDTISLFDVNIRHHMGRGFPLLTTKKMNWKNIVIENLWFLSGASNIKFLQEHGCRFWDPWADEHAEVPSAYGFFWRQFPGAHKSEALGVGFSEIDQIKWVLNELKRNPMSRRLVVTAWHPANACNSDLPPCHFTFVLNVQNSYSGRQLNLHLTQRSCDMALGVPYNIAGYALLLHLFARWSGIAPGILSMSLVDAHIYTKKLDESSSDYDHLPGLAEQLVRVPRNLPQLHLTDRVATLDDTMQLLLESNTDEIMKQFELRNYNPHPAIKFKVAV